MYDGERYEDVMLRCIWCSSTRIRVNGYARSRMSMSGFIPLAIVLFPSVASCVLSFLLQLSQPRRVHKLRGRKERVGVHFCVLVQVSISILIVWLQALFPVFVRSVAAL